MALKVRDIMHDVRRVDGRATVAEAARVMDRERRGSVLVEGAGRVEGIVTERDILRKVVACGLDPSRTQLRQVMSSPLVTVPSDADVAEASELMERSGVRRLVVLDGGAIVGVVTARDIAHTVRLFSGRYLGAEGEDEDGR
jgi:CBS domain-containing protein